VNHNTQTKTVRKVPAAFTPCTEGPGAGMAPHSVEAEEAVLGSILIDPEAIFRVSPLLHADDFFVVRNGWIWQALFALHERHEPIDFLTVCHELEARGQLNEIGGAAYVSHLVNAVPTAIHVEGYARIVERASLRRKLLGAASDIAQLAYDEDRVGGDPDDMVAQAAQFVFNARGRVAGRNVLPLSETVSAYYDHVQYRYEHRDEPTGIPTGFADLDRLLGGLQRSDLVIVAARPSMGKTALLTSAALNAVQRFRQPTGGLRHRALLFSLEMSHEQVAQRLVSQASGVNSHRLRQGHLTDEEWPLFIRATGELAQYPLWIDDTPSISTSAMRAKAIRLHAERGLDLILVDYLQLMTAPGRHENRTQEVSALSRSLKALARELNVPVIAAAQISRAVEQRQDKRPMLSDLRESDSIEADADVVMFIYRDEVYNAQSEFKNMAEVIVAKHRNGPTGTVTMFFRNELAQFANAVKRNVAR